MLNTMFPTINRESSMLGFGCMRFTRKGGAFDIDKAEKEVLRAIELGVNYFDTANAYTDSEEKIGMALADRIDRNGAYTYCMLGDGESEEGQVWEAAMFAAHYHLDNLVAIVDNNNLQIDGDVRDVAGLDNISSKFKSFGWQTIEVDGHDIGAVVTALKTATLLDGSPVCIVAHTVKGKGVSFMEGKSAWHGKAIPDAEFAQAMQELGGNV